MLFSCEHILEVYGVLIFLSRTKAIVLFYCPPPPHPSPPNMATLKMQKIEIASLKQALYCKR